MKQNLPPYALIKLTELTRNPDDSLREDPILLNASGLAKAKKTELKRSGVVIIGQNSAPDTATLLVTSSGTYHVAETLEEIEAKVRELL